jgi:hypothetical protein
MLTMTRERSSASSTVLANTLGTSGLLAVVLGTFLPWLRSGEVRRNSYASFGVLSRLVGFHGPGEIATRLWPLIAMCCAGVVVAAVAGWQRVAAVLGLATAGWSGAVACAVLLRRGDGEVHVVTVGPAVTITGAAVVLAAAILTLSSQFRQPHVQGNRR